MKLLQNNKTNDNNNTKKKKKKNIEIHNIFFLFYIFYRN